VHGLFSRPSVTNVSTIISLDCLQNVVQNANILIFIETIKSLFKRHSINAPYSAIIYIK